MSDTTKQGLQSDPQSTVDTRGVALNQVGISRVHYPVKVNGWERDESIQREVDGLFDLTVSLAAANRGIHMSRLIESLHAWEAPLNPTNLQDFLNNLRQEQGAAFAKMSCKFNWFVSLPAPETGRPSWQAITTTLHATQCDEGGHSGYTLSIPVTTLCPCSRAISDYGAHSQRGWVTARIEWDDTSKVVIPEEVFEKLKHAGSAVIYPLLKRPDERHVTMDAYENPAFVEDVSRKAVLALQEDERITNFRIDARNEESIHAHDAVASFSFGKLSDTGAIG